jgi:outer membrane protein assembly factor BamB
VRQAGARPAAALAALFAGVLLASAAFGDPRTDYALNCRGCHGPDGRGVSGGAPSLREQLGKFLWVPGGREYLIRVPGTAQSELSDARTAALLTWMVREFSPEEVPADFAPFTAAEVGRHRRAPLTQVEGVRRDLLRAIAVRAAAAPVPEAPSGFDYDVPLAPHSPWPKFRRNARQNGRSPISPRDSGRAPWVFRTGKGVFSSPVVDGDGTIYIGSGDRSFYAIDRDGAVKWTVRTGEIIDSSALLDDQGRVIFGSGDGHVYALNRTTGELLWTFQADDPAATSAFINWFEGNVAIGADGTLYVPNDNFCTYALRRDSGERLWCWKSLDQTWSLPAFDPGTGRLFLGNNFAFLRNVAALDAASGRKIWRARADGSVAASPLLTGAAGGGAVVVGAFDGYVRAFDPADGTERWRFGARDHIYASAAEMPDGTLIQPSADGAIYALNPADGSVRWTFDTREPIRSSPAIDAAGNIYVGSGEGRLFVLNADGSLRWSIRLIDAPRDDLNASPALGTDAIVIAGENGGIFSVPYDYCLRPGLQDPRCTVGGGEGLPPDGVFLLYTTPFGRLLPEPPADLDANQPVTLSLLVRRHGDTQLALIDSGSLRLTLEPEMPVHVDVSGDRRFVTIVPKTIYTAAADGTVNMRVRGHYLVNPQRNGLRFSGGDVGGSFDQTARFTVRPHTGGTLSLPMPHAPGERAGGWELYRLAAPLPTILPSYNQIGFDSIHYLIGLVEGDGTRALAWVVGGQPARTDDRTAVDPASRVRFPLEIHYNAGLLTMTNEAGFTIEFNGFPLPFEFFRVATRVDEHGEALYSPAVNTKTTCGKIDFYGEFLQMLGYCNPTTDLLNVFGGAELRPYEGGLPVSPQAIGRVRFDASYDRVTATLTGATLPSAAHNFGLLLVDVATGKPLPLNYMAQTTGNATAAGTIASVTLTFAPGAVRADARTYLMVDTYPAAVATLHFSASVPWHARLAGGIQQAWDVARRLGGRVGRWVALRTIRMLE